MYKATALSDFLHYHNDLTCPRSKNNENIPSSFLKKNPTYSATSLFVSAEGEFHLRVGKFFRNWTEWTHVGSTKERLNDVGSSQLVAHQSYVFVPHFPNKERSHLVICWSIMYIH